MGEEGGGYRVWRDKTFCTVCACCSVLNVVQCTYICSYNSLEARYIRVCLLTFENLDRQRLFQSGLEVVLLARSRSPTGSYQEEYRHYKFIGLARGM
jgi:hypothetical protein